MKRFSEQLKKKSDTIRLRATERADLRARLESYMEYHPLPAELRTAKKAAHSTKSKVQGIVSEPFRTISFNMTYIRSAVGAFAVFVVVAVPVLAERSVPGDVLYPVKTNITEEVRASLTLSPYAKIEWETKRLERRIAEARLLATEGNLTPEVEAVVAQAVKEHTDAVTQGIAAIRETDEDEAAIAEIAFASALSVQADVLEGYAASDPVATSDSDSSQEGHSVAVLVDALNDASDEAESAQQDSVPSYEALLAQVESQTNQAYETFASIEKQASDTQREDIQRRLDDVERKVASAIALYQQEDVEEITVDTSSATKSAPENQEVDTEMSQETPVPEAVEETDQINPEEQTTSTSVGQTDVVGEIAEDISPEDVSATTSSEELGVTEPSLPPVPSLQDRQNQAVDALRTVISDLQKLIIFMTDIDVRESLSVEDLVPVTPLKEEEVQNINTTIGQIREIQQRIDMQDIGDAISEKVSYGLGTVEERVSEAVTARDAQSFPQAQEIADGAYAMILDIEQLLAQQQKGVDAVSEEDTEEPVKVTQEMQEENAQDVQDELEVVPSESVIKEEVPVQGVPPVVVNTPN